MIKVGITGHNGFIGYHLYQTLKLYSSDFELIDFDRSFFEDTSSLDLFVSSCDVIVHLAALNRHSDPSHIYKTNLKLVELLIDSLYRTRTKAHVIVSSSSQEENNTEYGKSKREGRLAFSSWANRSGGRLSGLIIPNVFGPFGKPNYNSVIATFCYQLVNNQVPAVLNDVNLNLIYVGDLVKEIIRLIKVNDNTHEFIVECSSTIRVSEVLKLLQYFQEIYQTKMEFPILNNNFEQNLFNTYRSYIDLSNHFPQKFMQHLDDRGVFVEIAKAGTSGQTSFSTLKPGITRGNHFHTRKIERFAVIKGKAIIQLRKVGSQKVYEYFLDGNQPSFVDMPIWHAHNIKNVGEDTLYTIFWINESFNVNDPDTYFEIV